MSKVIVVYTTFPDEADAKGVSATLLEARLVACANIMAPHRAFYRWERKVEDAPEVSVIFKTRAELFEAVKDKILELHPYECPCVVAWPVEKGHGPFLQWVVEETAES